MANTLQVGKSANLVLLKPRPQTRVLEARVQSSSLKRARLKKNRPKLGAAI
jgi:hypothetical protein